MDSESRAIRLPIPGVGKMLCFCLLAGLVWAIWSADLDTPANPRQKKREKLWSPDATAIERIQAVEEWAVQGEYAIPELTRALNSPHENVRSTAVLALSRIGPLAQGCVPRLYAMMKDPSESVRANVIHALLQIGYNLPEAVPVLVESLNDPSQGVRASAEDALTRIGRPSVIPVCEYLRENTGPGRRHGLSVLINLQLEHERIAEAAHLALCDENVEVQSRALTILTFLDAYTVEEIVPLLASPSMDVKLLVLYALQQRPAEAGSVVPQIVSLLREDQPDFYGLDRRVVEQVFLTLKSMGPLAQEAVPLLAQFQKHPNPRFRAAAVDAASAIANDENFRRMAAMIMHDSSPLAVSAAGEALQAAYPDRVSELIAPLKARLLSGKPDEVMLAASAVYGIGPAAAELTPSLDACLKKPDLPRAIVVLALGQIGDAAQPAIPNLISLMKEKDLQTSIYWALGRIPPRSEQVAEIEKHIIKTLNETRGSVQIGIMTMRTAMAEDRVRKRIYAFEMMGKLARDRDSIGDVLMENVSEPDSSVRWTVLWALTNLKGQEDEIVPLMIDSMSDNSRYVQATVLIGLGKVAHQPELSVPVLMDHLHNPDPYLKTAAALSLASFPTFGESAIDVLQNLIDDESNSIQNMERQQQSYWEIRRFPTHLQELQTTSVKKAAEIALDAIRNRETQAGFQTRDGEEDE
ncbi:MAG: HEAT repeat domain-containing protein [Planctomycetaceae bacterium]